MIKIDIIITVTINIIIIIIAGKWWKDSCKVDDTPLRTIKTLTYLIVQEKGDAVLNNLTMIQDRNESELYQYIQKALKQSGKLAKPVAKSMATQKLSNTPKLSKTAHTQLISIISKLGTDESQLALNELYEFTLQYPQISLDPYLEKSSDFFKSFVTNGLENIKIEREKNKTLPESNKIATRPFRPTDIQIRGDDKKYVFPKVPTPENPEMAVEWLKSATCHLGLDPSKYGPELISQLQNGAPPMSIEAAEMAVRKAQERLDNFKLSYCQRR